MSTENVYLQILDIAEIADKLDFERRNKIESTENKIKKVINKPNYTRKIPHEAYLTYFEQKKQDQ